MKPVESAEQSRQHVETPAAEAEQPISRETDPLETLLQSKETSRWTRARRAANSIDSVIDSFFSEPRLDIKQIL